MAESDEGNRIAALMSVLDVARNIVDDLQANRMLARVIDAFSRMPDEDREIVLRVLEREVETRLLSREVADDLTKIGLRPNPNARLYFRVVEPEDRSGDVEMLAFMRAAYSVQRGVDALDPQWQTMVVMALRQMDPAARAQIDGFNRTMRTLLEEAARDEAPPSEKPPPEKASTRRRHAHSASRRGGGNRPPLPVLQPGFDRVSTTAPGAPRKSTAARGCRAGMRGAMAYERPRRSSRPGGDR